MSFKRPLALYGGKTKELMPGDQIQYEVDSYSLTNKEASTIPKLALVKPGTGNLECLLANADSSANGYAIGFATEAIAADAQGVIQTDGILTATVSEWDAMVEGGSPTGLTPGAIYYLSKAEAGKIASVPPTAPGVVARVGRALSTTDLDINLDYPIELS